MEPQTQVIAFGFVIGVVFGVVAQRSGFCFARGLREWVLDRNTRRAAAVVLAMATAILGTGTLAALGRVELSRSIYFPGSYAVWLVGAGGLLFGYGMMMARGCGSRALVLLGTGNLRAVLVLVMIGLAAAITLTGPLAAWRLSLSEWGSVSLRHATLTEWLHGTTTNDSLSWGVPVIVALGLVMWSLLGLKLYRWPREALAAAVIGGLVTAGWYVTGVVGADDFDPVPIESLTFVAPVSDSLLYLMLASGMQAGFGIVVVAGVVLGSFIAAIIAREFAWRGFESVADMRRLLLGGLWMGIGGALAMGCTVGQGLTGLSTLAWPSFVAVLGIISGGAAACRGPFRLRTDTAPVH